MGISDPRRVIGITMAAILAAAGAAAQQAQYIRQVGVPVQVPLYQKLGSHHYAITTRNPQAQRYFDQGLRLTWAFNHDEAIRSFAEGERIDSTCAMCAWGVAFASGPNINATMDSVSGVRAWRAIERAKRRANRVTTRERALIEALSSRYSPAPPAQRARLDSAWAQAVGTVAERFRDDLEVQVLHADAIMNLSPWHYWNRNGTPRLQTSTIIRRLERVIGVNANHPGACHLYIHAVEAVQPARALPCAERLASLMPGAGHLVHMPGHIYVRVGRYEDAIRLNRHAVHADREMLEGSGVARRGAYASGYYPHNYHFLSFAATMSGQSRVAIDAARETSRRLGLDAVRTAPWIESVTPIVQLTLVTFGRWQEILAEREPGDSIPLLAAMTWYARGVAHAALGDRTESLRDLRRLSEITAKHPAGDNAIALRIAVLALQGEIALRNGRPADAVSRFRDAVRMEDALAYNEPPTWYYPIRHSLGMALLAANRPAEAERVYRDDLARFPRNGWSLFGLAQSLERQGKVLDARRVRAEFDTVWSQADVKLTASRI
jgi:tetratricopeptide (TPR) repeat protein